jgi:hypothetical protein
MASDFVTPSVEQCGEEMLSCATVYDWYNTFSQGCKEVSNLLYAHVQPTAVHDVNIFHVSGLILGNR